MRPFTSTMPFSEALSLTLDAARGIERVESLALADARGRVAALDVSARVDVPPFDRSMMDGYAVRAIDVATARPDAPVALVVIDTLYAGRRGTRDVARGACQEIATGTPMPRGANAVVMVEDTTREGDTVLVNRPVSEGQHVGVRGGDLAAGSVVVEAGQVLTPARLGALAAVGAGDVAVFVRPAVAILSTGDELAEPGAPLGDGQIHDVNRVSLAALVARHGGSPVVLDPVGDDRASISAALDRALAADIVVVSGGSSVGDRDFVRDVLAARGRVLYHGIAVRPGKPTALAIVGDTPVFAMPGNPTSCLSNGYLLVVPFLRRVARLPAWTPRVRDLPLARAIHSPADRHQFFTVRVVGGRVEPAFKGSSAITSMADADGYIEIEAGTTEIIEGTVVRVRIFES